jgi:hypothetical protein
MCFLKHSWHDVLTLISNNSHNIVWHVDSAFGVNNGMKSHTGSTMSLGEGDVQSISTRQTVFTCSSTSTGASTTFLH